MVMNSLRFALSGKVFVSPSFLKDSFSGLSPLGWQFSPPSTLSMSMDGGQIAVGGRRTDEAPAFHP